MDDSISFFFVFFLKQSAMLSSPFLNEIELSSKRNIFLYGKISYVTLIMETNPFNRPIIGVIIKEKLLIAKNLLFLPLNM